MGEKKKPEKSMAISMLTPNSIIVPINGRQIRVALDKWENALLNMILAGQGRDLIQRTMAHWEDQDQVPSPKELRDITASMRDLATFSQEVCATAEAVKDNPALIPNTGATDIDFSDINKVPTVLDPKPDGTTGNPPQAGG